MAWSSLLNTQWVSRNDLQDAVTTGVFTLKAGQSIPAGNNWVIRSEVETWINAIVTSGTSAQWPQKSWIVPVTTTTTSTTSTTSSTTTTTTTQATTTSSTTTTTTTAATTTTSTTTTTTTTLQAVQAFAASGAVCDYNNFPTTKYINQNPPRKIYDDNLGTTLTTTNYMISLPVEEAIRSWLGGGGGFLQEDDNSIAYVAYPSTTYARIRTSSVTGGVVGTQQRYVKVENAVSYEITLTITSSTNTAIEWQPFAGASSAWGTNLISSPPTYTAVVGTYTANFTANTCQSVDARIQLNAGFGDGVVSYTVKVEQI